MLGRYKQNTLIFKIKRGTNIKIDIDLNNSLDFFEGISQSVRQN
jgi:hypothetical protein